MFYQTKCVYWNNRRSSAPICVRTAERRRPRVRERIRGGLGMINALSPSVRSALASYLRRGVTEAGVGVQPHLLGRPDYTDAAACREGMAR